MHERPTTGSHPRYGCHECREDAELVMSGRAFPSVRDQYEAHLKLCRECRRVHRVLLSVYEDPFEIPTPARGVRADREFTAIVRRTRVEHGVDGNGRRGFHRNCRNRRITHRAH